MDRARRPYWIALAIGIAAAAILLAMGRHPICTCGSVGLWVGARDSAQTSQMIADWYSLSHIVHGLIFYAVLAWIVPRWPVGWRFALALGIEAAWEVIENTPMVIDRYREETAALGYTGDSVINSISDVAWMMLGFGLARRLPVWGTIGVAVTFELFTLYMIRDNMTLNVLMLFAPIDAIKVWQGGG